MSIIIPQDVPVYQVLDEQGFFDGVELHAEGAIIAWPDEPNENMEPLNELAKKAAYAYSEKLDALFELMTPEQKRDYPRQRPDWQKKDKAIDGARKSIRLDKPSDAVPLMPPKNFGMRKRAQTIVDDEPKGKKHG
jgi:hypothetical protein